tara:strand:+ start:373 stop:564 length:192 start_codon:yes stop_codon:yes gene_type:complete
MIRVSAILLINVTVMLTINTTYIYMLFVAPLFIQLVSLFLISGTDSIAFNPSPNPNLTADSFE